MKVLSGNAGILDFSRALNWLVEKRKSVQNRKRNLRSLIAIIKRSDGWKFHFSGVENSHLSTILPANSCTLSSGNTPSIPIVAAVEFIWLLKSRPTEQTGDVVDDGVDTGNK